MTGGAHDSAHASRPPRPGPAGPAEGAPVAKTVLQDSEARLRAIYDGTSNYIGLISPDGTVLDCNRASLTFAGNTRDAVVGLPLWDTPWFSFTPDAPEQLRRWVARAAAGERIRREVTLFRPGDEPMTFDFSLQPIRDDEGRVTFIVPEGRDITEHRRAEDALRAREAQYRALFNSIDAGFCVLQMVFDDDGHPVDYVFLEGNPAFLAQTGLVDPIGRTARELVPSLEQHWFEVYGRVAMTGEPVRFENNSIPMGRWFDVFAFRVGDPGDRKVALLFRDVSEARRAAVERERLLAELNVERTRLQEVFQQAPSFIVVFRGPEHVYEFVNESYYQLVGERDLLGKSLWEGLPELREQGFGELLDRVLETGEAWTGRETPALLRRTSGALPETRYLNMVFQPITEADGTRSGVVVHGFDVTEQVLARREVERLLTESERARADAETANRAKSEFLAVMSHELRTPLNAISGYTDLLDMGIHGPITEAQRMALGRIQLSQRHLLGLINEVLNYARLETGTVDYDLEDIEVRGAITSAESLVMPQARAKEHRLSVRECPPELVVRADAEKLRQILVNLLFNAVKFTEPGGHVEISCRESDGRVVITVQDDGIGIPEDKLAVIFDPFVQVRADLTRQHEGTGLGLAISRDLARGMAGDLTVQSEIGVGSTFCLTLPLARSDSAG
jgi:PAS domain S-box-containing protein